VHTLGAPPTSESGQSSGRVAAGDDTERELQEMVEIGVDAGEAKRVQGVAR